MWNFNTRVLINGELVWDMLGAGGDVSSMSICTVKSIPHFA